LTILRGEVEIGLRGARSAAEYRDILVSNLEEIERMSKIVSDLLLLSRSDMGQEVLSRESVDLRELVQELINQLAMLAEQKRIVLTGDIQPVPLVLGDKLRLRQMAANLVANAIRYTSEGGRVNVRLEEVAEGVKLVVEDTGIGIPEADLPRIFDRFYRVDKARSREEGGSGLGLSIVKWIVDAHHGDIKVESVVNEGTTFIVVLPFGDLPALEDEIKK
jgi:signal transduction histidine kinase